MIPTQNGQIVRFHTPFLDEDPEQLYVIMESFLDVEKPRALIKALGFGSTFAPTTTVLIEDLEVISFTKSELIGKELKIKLDGGFVVTGIGVEVINPEMVLLINEIGNEFVSNIMVIVSAQNGKQFTGLLVPDFLFVNQNISL